MGIFTRIKQTDVIESALLQRYENTSYDFLKAHRWVFQAVGYHIIYILNKDNISIDVVQVFNQRSMTTWTEQNRTIFVAERFVINRSSYSICA